ncbi:MAG: tetratricopeptide repeat protein [Simkaniaceae bacterium]|nr:tetratricopeptide repeat protein [Simkaniaceae bacterium]
MDIRNGHEILGWGERELEDIRFVGYSYLKQGRYADALTFFETLAVVSNNHLYDLRTLGALYLETGNHLSALDYLERALKIDETDGPTLLNRAKALLLLGYKKQGLAQSERLTENPDPHIADGAQALRLAYS